MSIIMDHRTTDRIECRRQKIQQLLARGNYSHRDISAKLQIPKTTVTRDIQFLNEEAKNAIRKYVDERLPQEYERILIGLNDILQNTWETSEEAEIETREKLQAYSLIKECYAMKLDLLTNPAVLEEASSFIIRYKNKNDNNIKNKDEVEVTSENKEKKDQKDVTAESNDSTSSITNTTTTNQVF